MRYGLKWWQLLIVVLVTTISYLVQRIVTQDVQTYEVVSTASCEFVESSVAKNGDGVKGNFKCGARDVSVDAALLSKYFNHGMKTSVACTFKVGSILGDEVFDCKES